MLEHAVTAKEAIVKTNSPNVDMIPAHIDLVAIEIELVDKENRESMLKQALKRLRMIMIILLLTVPLLWA